MVETAEVVIAKPVAVKIDTAARMAEVSRCTIYAWLKSGKLKSVPVGADKRILVAELEQFLREGRGGTIPRALSPVARGRGRPKLHR